MSKKAKHLLVKQDVMAQIGQSNRTIKTVDKIASPTFILPQLKKKIFIEMTENVYKAKCSAQ